MGVCRLRTSGNVVSTPFAGFGLCTGTHGHTAVSSEPDLQPSLQDVEAFLPVIDIPIKGVSNLEPSFFGPLLTIQAHSRLRGFVAFAYTHAYLRTTKSLDK